jgi:transcription elongation factor Elf1
MERELQVCPVCCGERVVGGVVDDDAPARDVRCPACHGRGQVTDDELTAIEAVVA